MVKTVTDEDIRKFIQQNRDSYTSQIALIQAAVKLLWPKGSRQDGSKRVVQLCLEEFNVLPVGSYQQPSLKPLAAIQHAPE